MGQAPGLRRSGTSGTDTQTVDPHPGPLRPTLPSLSRLYHPPPPAPSTCAEPLSPPARPKYLDLGNRLQGAQPEMQPRMTRRRVPPAGGQMIHLLADPHHRPNTVPITLRAAQF